MSKAPAILLLSLALAGCAAAPQARLASDPAFEPGRYAWDGAGEDPNQPRPATETSRASRTAARSIQAQDGTERGIEHGMEAEQDAQLSRSLVICKDCLRPQPAEDSRLARASD